MGIGNSVSQQFYVTHCARNDSVLNTVGFSVRAASSTDPALLKMAMEYPAFELPMDQWAKRPSRFDAPRRLARVRVAEGVMVVHTGYLEKDTMNRDRSFFTHLMVLPAATPSEVLMSWNAPGWRTDYPSGEAQTLGIPTRVPNGTNISEKALREFLSAPDLGPGGALSTALWSDKLRTDLAGRKALVGQVLHGVVLAMADPNRNRLFIHAEPGLVALLIFAAAELLPPSIAADLTFSTFEPAHRGLREYKRALIIGTYLANPARGLDAELASARGYAVDAINPARGSRELQAEVPPGIARLVELAAAGKKKSIKAVHEICGNNRMSAAELGRAVLLAEGLERLDAKTHTVEDLLELQKHPQGQKAVAGREAELWPQVCALVVDQERDDVLNAFRAWFAAPNRVDQLAGAGFAALSGGNVAGWHSRWRVLQNVLPKPAELGAALDRLLSARADAVSSLSPAGRSAIRASLGNVRGLRREVLGPILTPGTIAELDQLLGDKSLSAFGLAFVTFTARTGNDPAMRKRASAYLKDAPPDVLGHYAHQLGPDYDLYYEAADELFDLADDGSGPLFDRLLGRGSEYLEPAAWMWAAERLELFKGDEWTEHLLQDLRLAKFLRSVGADPAGRPAWDWTFERVKGTAILDPNGTGRAIWVQLNAAEAMIRNEGGDPVAVFPSRITTLRAAGRRLFALTETTGPIPSASEIRTAFDKFGFDESAGLDAVYNLVCGDTLPSTNPTGYQRFGSIFGALLPSSNTSFQPNNRSLTAWLKLSDIYAEEARTEMHRYFFQHPDLAPTDARQRILLVDEHRTTLDSSVATDVRMDSKRTRVEEKQEAQAEKERAARKSKWSLWMLLIAVAGVGGAIAFAKFGGKLESTEGQELVQNNEEKPPQEENSKGKEHMRAETNATPAGKDKEALILERELPSPPLAPTPREKVASKPVDKKDDPNSKATQKADGSAKPRDLKTERKMLIDMYAKLQLPISETDKKTLEAATASFLKSNDDVAEAEAWKLVLSTISLFEEKQISNAQKMGAKLNGDMKQMKDESLRQLLRDKAQEFCEGYIPPKLALEDSIWVKDGDEWRRCNRSMFTLKNGRDDHFSFDPEGCHEKDPKGATVLEKMKTLEQDQLRATRTSQAAFSYWEKRKQIKRWSLIVLQKLRKDLTNEVFTKESDPVGKHEKDRYKIADWNGMRRLNPDGNREVAGANVIARLDELIKLMECYPTLFDQTAKTN